MTRAANRQHDVKNSSRNKYKPMWKHAN